MNQETLEKLEELLPLLEPRGTFLTVKDFAKAFKALAEALKTLRKENEISTNKSEREVSSRVKEFLDTAKEFQESVSNTKDGSESAVQNLTKLFKDTVKELEDEFEEFKTNVRDGDDGYTPKFGVDYFTTKDKRHLIQDILKKLGKKIEPLEASQIVDKINSLPVTEEFQIDAQHIKNLPQSNGDNRVTRSPIPEAPRDGQTYGRKNRGWEVISPGGSVTVETPSGDVDASNVTYTVTSIPKWIVVDGITYFEDAGYTRSTLTLTIATPPVSFIRSIY